MTHWRVADDLPVATGAAVGPVLSPLGEAVVAAGVA